MRYYLSTLASCITNSSLRGTQSLWLDHRYFYRCKDMIGRYTCGLAREAAAVVLRESQPGRLSDSTWLIAMRIFENSRSVIGFLVEQACISAMADVGFNHAGICFPPLIATIFDPRHGLINSVPRSRDCDIFFVPSDPNYKDIDALYVRISHEDRAVYVVPIQITVAKRHKDSERAFYTRWREWKTAFPDYTLTTDFVWIDEFDKSWDFIRAEHRAKSGPKELFPDHKQICITVAEVHASMGLELDMLRQTRRNPPLAALIKHHPNVNRARTLRTEL